jgi:hypothetical protein
MCPGAVEDPERGVMRIDKRRSHFDRLLEHILQRCLGADNDIRRGKVAKAIFSVSSCGHGSLAVNVS